MSIGKILIEKNIQENKFITLNHGYHGDTIGAVSVGGIKTFHKIFKDLIFENIESKAHLSIAVITILKMK